jgi:ABC-type transport system involved in multi-copper enzyme maturation permease subunit
VHLALWSGLLGGALALALFVIPNAMPEDEIMTLADRLDAGRQFFFGLGAIATGIGAIIALQDSLIEDKSAGTVELVLSKPLSRTAYVLGRLVPNLAAFLVAMIAVPSVLGAVLFAIVDPGFSGAAFLLAVLLLALHLVFYATLSILLGTLLSTRGPYLGIGLGVLLGGTLVPVAAIVRFSPWKLSDLAILIAGGMPLPQDAATMIVSTAVWSALFLAGAIVRMQRTEL